MAEKLRLFMGVVKRKIPGLGFQLVSIIDDEGDEDEEEQEDDHDEL